MKKAQLFWPIAAFVVVFDFLTKRMILAQLSYGETRQVIGDYVRFTLGYNNGVAFGLNFGNAARPFLIVFTLVAIAGIIWVFRTTEGRHRLQIFALGLVLGGALGNLLDRFQHV
ncbi:MAG TPA: signal peptidase II, partial [Longimicrobiales bacterium]|nr:signal peptidase II [Longimicrobiales bacterium]